MVITKTLCDICLTESSENELVPVIGLWVNRQPKACRECVKAARETLVARQK